MRFQYIPPDEPPRVTIRVTFFLAGLLVALVGAVLHSDVTVGIGGVLACTALFMTAIDP